VELTTVHVGLDLGKQQDPTALVVAEVTEESAATPAEPLLPPYTRYRVQMIERLPLGTSYPGVATYVVKVLAALYAAWLTHAKQLLYPPSPDSLSIQLFADATGVGMPVVDILREAIDADRSGAAARTILRPITFVHGEQYTRSLGVQPGRMGKAYLVSRLQALLQQQNRIDLPKGEPDILAMVEELKTYDIHIDQDGHDTYGAFKVGTHDDLATALGLAVLEDPREYRVDYVDISSWVH